MTLPEFLKDGGRGGVSGVAVGIVTDNQDPEDLGRVRLSYPWRAADDESYWARLAVPMAGAEMGSYFLPEVGDEVLVAFENGDLNYPYVLGGLWNGAASPPETNNGSNDVRTVRSRGGHELRFDDADGGGSLEIHTGSGHTVRLDDEAGTVTIEDGNGTNRVELDSQGAVSISAGTELSVSAPTLTLKADGNASVEAGGVLTLKGAMIQLN